ncbi:MAG TPA: leucine--tRNA ligase [Saprospiraceae bacterium]|nr:leucine--tRNA ligase [Saprospiraceae bacterium]
MEFNFSEIEKKWLAAWEQNGTYQVSNQSDRPKYYVLDMFPYPSGSGLHVGHPLGYIASDIFARYKRLKGFNVLHPMGYDAFGLPAEEHAIRMGVHPAISTKENTERYREQLESIGLSFDWSREIRTSDPSYHKWTQWIFTLLFEHYYDKKADKAKPIKELVAYFEQNGNRDLDAATTYEELFSAEDWAAFSRKEKDEVLMHYRLAFRSVGTVNWCEALGTVLANDQVKNGLSERGQHPVELRPMTQWFLRITAYADRLLEGLKTIDWTESLKSIQRHWIGRSEGALVKFDLQGLEEQLPVYTTRPDTIFGVTFMVLAPEHELVDRITTPEQKEEVNQYVKYVAGRSERERNAEVKDVTGSFTGGYAIHPFTKKPIPIYISEYVLKDYGTGAIMAVPSDDERDMAFAKKFGIEIIDVIDKSDYPNATLSDKVGKVINSDFITGMEVPDAIEEIIKRVEAMGIGRRGVNYKMRDAGFSRQRYWGEPIPIVYDADGVAFSLPLSELPLELPDVPEFKPTADGQSPLGRAVDWVNLPDGRKRETDTMPGTAGSAWYFMRYTDPHNNDAFAGKEAIDYWQNVDLYVGGSEHAVAHLMYSRFWTKFLYDLGYINFDEPFKKLINQGMIQGIIEIAFLKKENGKIRFISADMVDNRKDFSEFFVPIEFVSDYGKETSYLDEEGLRKFAAWNVDFAKATFEMKDGYFKDGQFTPTKEGGQCRFVTHSEAGKMSKSRYNTINPDDIIAEYGADCFRMYEMFLGPIEQSKPWNTNGIDGISKFLRRFWALFYDADGKWLVTEDAPSPEALKVLHQTIKKVLFDMERFSFNTCVSGFMVAVNELRKLNCHSKEILEDMVRLMAPFAPFITEELWTKLGHEGSVHLSSYPDFDEKYLVKSSIDYPISINGKKRAVVPFPADASKSDIENAVRSLEIVQKWVGDKEIKRLIVVPGRMVNVVV